jgi:DNA-directed RNA polymerase beta' subunit
VRGDANAWDRLIGSTKRNFQQNDYAAGSKTGSDSDIATEGEENIIDDAMDTDEGSGDDTAEAPAGVTVARTASGKVKGPRGRNERVLTPNEVRAHLRWLFKNESVICSLLFGRQGPYAPIVTTKRLPSTGLSPVSADMFFLDVVTVSPTRFRPASKMGDKFFEHPHNELLAKIINTTYALRDLSDQMKEVTTKGASSTAEDQNRIFGKTLDALLVLQADVNSFIDSSKNTGPVRQGKLLLPGVKQGLEKKEGLFRMHMMVLLIS